MARLTLARKIAAISLLVWMKGVRFNADLRGSVPRSRLVGSDLRAWHRLWADYGLIENWATTRASHGADTEFNIFVTHQHHDFGGGSKRAFRVSFEDLGTSSVRE
jgi:hypothetical protein